VLRRFFLIAWHVMPLILISGFAVLFLSYGGMAFVGWNVHLMMPLGSIMNAVFVVIVFGPCTRFRRTTDRATAIASIDRSREAYDTNWISRSADAPKKARKHFNTEKKGRTTVVTEKRVHAPRASVPTRGSA
jgi:hypothetical protein